MVNLDFFKRPIAMIGAIPVTVGALLVGLLVIYLAFFRRR